MDLGSWQLSASKHNLKTETASSGMEKVIEKWSTNAETDGGGIWKHLQIIGNVGRSEATKRGEGNEESI